MVGLGIATLRETTLKSPPNYARVGVFPTKKLVDPRPWVEDVVPQREVL